MKDKKNKNIDEISSDNNNNNDDKIKIINGDGKLNISPVYDYIEMEKPKSKNNEKQNIIIPDVKKELRKNYENISENDSNNNNDDDNNKSDK